MGNTPYRYRKPAKYIANEPTTCRRHVEKYHKPAYDDWREANNYVSKLPKVVAARKEADEAAKARLEPHLREQAKKARVVPYSHELFRDAAIQWLIAQDMATNGVKVPTRKAARYNLQKRLMSPKAGLISMTCDAWQASNVDADLVVTGRWNEKKSEGVWEQQQVFKIVKRLGFGHKVGWVTCDNASCLNNATWICMAHTINLSSQPLISTYSKTAHFDPDEDAIEDIIPAVVDE
ncbi:hypothetical protein CPC08DRAFT_767316 [Agrocybe pediades]|nr:hypothetical protein CPC08DRAFT_767316 [Agrocybe pediades]